MVRNAKFSWEKPKTNQKGLNCTVGDIPCTERTLAWRLCSPSWVRCNRVEFYRLIDFVGSCQGVLFPLVPVAMWFELKAEIHLNRVIECKAETWTSSNFPVNPEEKRLGCWVCLQLLPFLRDVAGGSGRGWFEWQLAAPAGKAALWGSHHLGLQWKWCAHAHKLQCSASAIKIHL